MSPRLHALAAFALSAALMPARPLRAEAPKAPEASLLDGYLELLAKKRLLAPPAESVDELSAVIERAQHMLLAGNKDEATSLLVEAVDGPRFRMFEELDEYLSACLLASALLLEQHALKSAQRTVERVLARGPEQAAFGPAFRRAVDIALARGDLAGSASRLETFADAALPEDSQNELRYLKALSAYEAGELKPAETHLAAVTGKSRFYASAQYLLGAIAAQRGEYKTAEDRFCRVTSADKNAPLSFYADGRFFPVRDLSYLGLGRVAHETARSDDAFYYYFQVPSDSTRVSEALFEAAWASYEGQDHDAALDSLDQLEARYPRSAFAAEAGVLRGYVHLARCEFSEAEKHLSAFSQRFGRTLAEIDALLDSPASQSGVYRDLVARSQSADRIAEGAAQGDPTPDSLLLALVAADPEFYRLHSEIASLSAELARSGNVPTELGLLMQRVQGKDAPATRLDEQSEPVHGASLLDEIDATKRALHDFGAELSVLARARAGREELSALSSTRRALEGRLVRLEERARSRLAQRAAPEAQPAAADLVTRLQQDQSYVRALQGQAQSLRARLEQAADAAGERALRALRARLAKELRRARIGRIDAVMGSKRKVELQVESLAAGRFPPELTDPLRMQSLLRDDEEYWPFEGEDWPDEFVERYAEEE